MKPIRIIAVVLSLVSLTTAALSQPSSRLGSWGTDFKRARAVAKANHALMLVYFSATWCGHCRWYRLHVFPTQSFLTTTKQMVLVDVDVDQNKELRQKFDVDEMPQIQLMTADERIFGVVRGYRGPDPLLKAIRLAKLQIAKEKRPSGHRVDK